MVIYRAVNAMENARVAINAFNGPIPYVATGTCQRLIMCSQSIVTMKLVEIHFPVREPFLAWTGLSIL